MKKTVKKTKITRLSLREVREQFSEGFHTGLRKGVHSDISSLVHHIIRRLDPVVWHDFIEWVRPRVIRKSFTSGQALIDTVLTQDRYAYRHWSFNHYHWSTYREVYLSRTKLADYYDQATLFDQALGCLPADDWSALASWLKFCIAYMEGREE